VDQSLAKRVAQGLGLTVPAKPPAFLNESVPADGNPAQYQPKPAGKTADRSPALAMVNSLKGGVATRKVAILATDGVDDTDLKGMKKALLDAGALPKVVAPRLGLLTSAKGAQVPIDFSFLTSSSVLFDAVYIPGGDKSVQTLRQEGEAVAFAKEAYKHCKTIGANGAGTELLTAAGLDPERDRQTEDKGLIVGGVGDIRGTASKFISAMARHRHWERETVAPPA
jgi:catalase